MKEKIKALIDKAADKFEKVMVWLETKLVGSLEGSQGTGKVHYIKCETEYFNDVVDDYKSFEIRKNDRDYEPGDDIVLREYDKQLNEITGRECRVSIIYMLEDYPGIELGYCILGIEEY